MSRDLTTIAGKDFERNFIATVAEGGGPAQTELLMKINDHTGEITYGAENIPVEPGSKFVVPISGFLYGYIVWRDRRPVEKHLEPLGSGRPRPEPPGGHYAPYPEDGPRPAAELVLNSMDERGFSANFTMSLSSSLRMDNLSRRVAVQLQTDSGREGFRNPVIALKAGSYPNQKWARTVWHFDYDVLDWLHDDGETLLSQRKVAGAKPANGGGKAPPVDDVTEEDLDFLR